MLKFAVGLFVIFFGVEVALLVVWADYTSWEIPLLQVLATGLFGAALIRYVKVHHGRRIAAKLAACEFPGDVLFDAVLILAAGVLLILPGVMTDVAGLLLLIPPVRWLVAALVKRWWWHGAQPDVSSPPPSCLCPPGQAPLGPTTPDEPNDG